MLVKLRNHVFFRNLSEGNIQEIIKSMKTQVYKVGEVVFREGERGDQLYLVEEGAFRCFFQHKKDDQVVYRPGEAFGELAILYNTTRASTIVCEEEGKLYSLDRTSFNAILRDDIIKKTKICEDTLNKNQLFSTMSAYEKCKLIENLKEVTYPAGKYIIKEGQIGDKFFIISEGKLVVEKVEDGEIKSVNYLKDGDFFGEIALIRNLPRQASVKTLTSAKVFYIERSAFKRLLGTLEQLLKRN
jgi:cAMP-dependent protein kinase regulator